MDRQNENGLGFFDGVKEAFKREARRRRSDNALLFRDALIFFLSFIFARCHVVFGAYPLSLALLSVLNGGVWVCSLGAVLGSLSLGKSGLIYAVISLVTLFLRIIVSGGAKEERRLFSESLPLRISAGGISAFLGGVYQMLLEGFSLTSVLFALFGVALTMGFALIFSGIYLGNTTVGEVLFSKRNIFSGKSFQGEKERLDNFVFLASLLCFVYVCGLALREYSFFGINANYLYSGIITLFSAKRFGVGRAMTVGFLSALSGSGIYAVSFALSGLGAGVFFAFGTPYAMVASGALLCIYSYYVGGFSGVASIAPEYALACVAFLPTIRYFAKERGVTVEKAEKRTPERMVNIAALSYKNKGTRASFESVSASIKSLSEVLKNGGKNEGRVSYESYRDAVLCDVREHCLSCPNFESCTELSPAPCAENVPFIAEKLASGERIFADDVSLFPKYCVHKGSLYDKVIKGALALESRAKKNCRMASRSRDYELISRAIDESIKNKDEELCLSTKESAAVVDLLLELGMGDASAKVFGKRCRKVICAGLDNGGKISTSKELKEAIEKKLDGKFSDGDFYKKDDYVLCEFEEIARYGCVMASAGDAKEEENASGDCLVSFKSDDGRLYLLLSDGEGSGEGAREVSSLACDYLSRILKSSVSKGTAISSLNQILRGREEERGATVDLFELDLFTGEAIFCKCGAVASYIKRDDSIFKVRSQSAPIGLMSSVDAESIRVDVKRGDYVILLSDGVLPENEDTTWFFELLSRDKIRDTQECANLILENAKKRNISKDDMTVAVIKIGEVA